MTRPLGNARQHLLVFMGGKHWKTTSVQISRFLICVWKAVPRFDNAIAHPTLQSIQIKLHVQHVRMRKDHESFTYKSYKSPLSPHRCGESRASAGTNEVPGKLGSQHAPDNSTITSKSQSLSLRQHVSTQTLTACCTTLLSPIELPPSDRLSQWTTHLKYS